MQVNSYQHIWGGISGGVEAHDTLLRRALEEVRADRLTGCGAQAAGCLLARISTAASLAEH